VVSHASKRLLIVGDPALSRNLMQLVLNRLHYQVDCTLDVADTLARLADSRYDLVFIALSLPGGSGLDLARRLRREFRTLRQVPILLFGDAWDEAAVRRACAEAGLQGYLAKPLSISRWLSVIRQFALSPRGGVAAKVQRPVEAVVDLERLRGVTGDDLQLAVEIGTLYVGTARHYLREMQAALASGSDLARIAHALKGASRNIGARRVGDLAEQIETQGGAAAELERLREEVERVAAYFDALAAERQQA
jgi:two-component system sensor histidine kinase RpfC